MALTIGCVIAALAFAIAMAIGAEKIRAAQTGVRTIQAADGHIVRVREPVKRDPLSTLTVEWLADSRPAWETVEAPPRRCAQTLQGKRPARGDRLHGDYRLPSKPSDARSAGPKPFATEALPF